MYNVDETDELVRAERDFDLGLLRMLRDPQDQASKESLAALRAKRDQARNVVDSRIVRTQVAGYVSDVRVAPGQHVNPGDVLAAVAPPGEAKVSVIAMVPATYRPMLRAGAMMRLELDGFRYEYTDLAVDQVEAEAVGPAEMQRFLGPERADAVHLDPGAKVLVSAKLPTPTFTSDGQSYGYFDGLTGNAEVRVRREPILVMLVPALRRLIPN
jgi:membrane fusion protein (multidrug efflux system)